MGFLKIQSLLDFSILYYFIKEFGSFLLLYALELYCPVQQLIATC